MSSKPLLYLIDGGSQMYRAYHAPIRTAEGAAAQCGGHSDQRGLLASFVTMLLLLKLITRRPSLRHRSTCRANLPETSCGRLQGESCADAGRSAGQIPLSSIRPAKRSAFPSSRTTRYEADDVIGTLARHAAAAGYSVVLVTGDKDFFQLVDENIRVFNPKEDGTWYDVDGVKEKFGVRPDQVDVLALMGDSIDNVKGVPGIGEKGARVDQHLGHARRTSGACR